MGYAASGGRPLRSRPRPLRPQRRRRTAAAASATVGVAADAPSTSVTVSSAPPPTRPCLLHGGRGDLTGLVDGAGDASSRLLVGRAVCARGGLLRLVDHGRGLLGRVGGDVLRLVEHRRLPWSATPAAVSFARPIALSRNPIVAPPHRPEPRPHRSTTLPRCHFSETGGERQGSGSLSSPSTSCGDRRTSRSSSPFGRFHRCSSAGARFLAAGVLLGAVLRSSPDAG